MQRQHQAAEGPEGDLLAVISFVDSISFMDFSRIIEDVYCKHNYKEEKPNAISFPLII